MAVTWSGALAWRVHRQLLESPAPSSVAEVVERVGAIAAYPRQQCDHAVRIRSLGLDDGAIDEALRAGVVTKTYAFRGATHLLTPGLGAAFLALRESSRMWELPSWRDYYGLEPSDWDPFREAVGAALADGPLTHAEFGRAVTAVPRFAHLGIAFGGNDTLLKALAWHGDLVFGPDRDGEATFQSMTAVPSWPGLPDLDEAGRRAVEHYLGAYGPSTPRQLRYWIGEGLGAGGGLRRWLRDLGPAIAEIEIEGETRLIRAQDADDLAASAPSPAVHFVPGRDPWLLGPGTADEHSVPPEHRSRFSRGAHPVVVAGRAAGVWTVDGDRVEIEWFGARSAGTDEVDAGIERLGTALGVALRPAV